MKHKIRNLAPLILSCLPVIFVFSVSAFASITLPQYRDKIKDTRQSVSELIYLEVDDSDLAGNKKTETETLKRIRTKLPADERVEWENASMDVDNGWILEKLTAYEKEKDSNKRTAILGEISDRLSAIEAKLNELEQSAVAGRTKDENKQKLSEILNRPEYRKPEEKGENFIQKSWREFKEWLRGIFPKPKLGDAPSGEGFKTFSYVLQIVIFGLVFAIIGFLIYKFAPFLGAKFKKWEKKDRGVRVILGERLAEDENSANLFSDAEKLAREGNLKAAIRKGYIALLCELSDRKIIGLAQHKTNRDYLRDVRGMSELHQNMSGLTGTFERHWYGSTSTEEKDWEDFRQKYQRAVSNGQRR